MKCFKCNNELGLWDDHIIDGYCPEYSKPWIGTVDVIHPGYGSSHDGDWLTIGICNKCLTDAINSGVILKYSDDEKKQSIEWHNNLRR